MRVIYRLQVILRPSNENRPQKSVDFKRFHKTLMFSRLGPLIRSKVIVNLKENYVEKKDKCKLVMAEGMA